MTTSETTDDEVDMAAPIGPMAAAEAEAWLCEIDAARGDCDPSAEVRAGYRVEAALRGVVAAHAARVAAEREADGLGRDLMAVAKARDEAVADAKRLREREEHFARARRATQAIIAEVGADGPMDVDEAAGRIVARLGAVTQERDALLALLAAAACGELPRCDCWHGCARLAAQEATEGETAWSCDECLAKHERAADRRARAGWRDLPHAAALRAAMGGAK